MWDESRRGWKAFTYNIRTSSPWVFIAFTFLSGFGMIFFIMQVWTMVNDVIDYIDVRKRFREESSAYACFLFTRKLGQTIAGIILATSALIWFNYKSGSAVQGAGTIAGMYGIAVAIPAVLYIVIGVVLRYMYPISRKVLLELHVQKEAIRGKI